MSENWSVRPSRSGSEEQRLSTQRRADGRSSRTSAPASCCKLRPVAPETPGATAATGRESYVSPTTSDMALMPFPSLKMGPGQSSRSHTADEFVLLSEIEEGIGIYEKFIKQLAEIL